MGNVVMSSGVQCVAVFSSLLQSVAVCCSLLQSAAVCCSLLQSVARCNTANAAGYRAQWPFIIGLICAKRHPAKKQKSLQSSNMSLKFALLKNEP